MWFVHEADFLAEEGVEGLGEVCGVDTCRRPLVPDFGLMAFGVCRKPFGGWMGRDFEL